MEMGGVKEWIKSNGPKVSWKDLFSLEANGKNQRKSQEDE